MSIDVSKSFVDQFSGNLQMLAQQLSSRLYNAVDVEPINGETAYFDQIGVRGTAQKRTTRHGDSPFTSTPHARRRLSINAYEEGDYIDVADRVKMLVEPSSAYARAIAASLGRAIDQEIIDAALGTAWTKDNSAVALPAGQKVDVQVRKPGASAADMPMNIWKLLAAQEILNAAEVPDNDRFLVVTARQYRRLLQDAEVSSGDFNLTRPLQDGMLPELLGFKIIRSELLGLDGNNDRRVIAFQRDGLKLGVAEEITGRITERADKSFSTYVYGSMAIGATRMQEKFVVEIACDDAA